MFGLILCVFNPDDNCLRDNHGIPLKLNELVAIVKIADSALSKPADYALHQETIESIIRQDYSYKGPVVIKCHCRECRNLLQEWKQKITASKIKKPPKPKASGFVYLAANKRNGYIKIGFSRNPKHREYTLQSEDPDVEIVFSFPATYTEEKELHAKFSNKRLRGEWFRLEFEDIEYIKSYSQKRIPS